MSPKLSSAKRNFKLPKITEQYDDFELKKPLVEPDPEEEAGQLTYYDRLKQMVKPSKSPRGAT